jgi:hypothetical protein
MATKKNPQNTPTTTAETIEIITDQEIEPVVNFEIGRVAAEEAFMAEFVTVYLHETTDDNAAPHVLLNVNGVSQPIMRGVKQKVRRKFVEVLARCKETRYTQRVDPHEPDRITMEQKTALAYPFSVVEDMNPKGAAWLAAVMAERA